MCRGVKQGDPLSPALFNIVMDELLCKVRHEYGLKIGEASVAAVAYADDLIILGPDERHVQYNLDIIAEFLERRGLTINVAKCTALSTSRVLRKKKLCCHTTPRLAIGGEPIPCITPDEQFKYLGRNYEFSGEVKISSAYLRNILGNLQQAPLKPHQKFRLLTQHVIPKAAHDLQYFSITGVTLKKCDGNIRAAIRQIIKLPKSTPTSFFYAKSRDGGLGIFVVWRIISRSSWGKGSEG